MFITEKGDLFIMCQSKAIRSDLHFSRFSIYKHVGERFYLWYSVDIDHIW